MSMVRPTLRLGVALGALAFGLPAPQAGAQSGGVVTPDRGWVGVSVYVDLTGPQRGTARITDVSDGSPAAKAGVQPGDILLTINGHGAQDQFGDAMMTLRAGDPVKLVLVRNGRRREVQLTAVPRPLEVASGPRWNISLGSDSMADVMFRAMDSLRLRLIQGGDGLLGVITVPGPDDVPAAPAGSRTPVTVRLRSVSGDPVGMLGAPGRDGVTVQLLPEVRPPFSFYVFRGDRTDSLRAEMDQLNQEIRGLRAQRSERLRQLTAEFPSGREQQAMRDDADLQRLNRSLDEAGQRATDLRASMERVAKEEAQGQQGYVSGSAPGQAVTSFRPLAPYLLGQNRAAGAEVVNLRPELAEYFQVDGGVLVVDVPEGTPAAQAGIQPGDVLINIDGQVVRNIQELRMGLSRGGAEPWRVTLVRKGRTLEVQLPR